MGQKGLARGRACLGLAAAVVVVWCSEIGLYQVWVGEFEVSVNCGGLVPITRPRGERTECEAAVAT